MEPSNQQEAYDMMQSAFELSEKLREPVIVRVVTRLAHSRAAVEVREASEMQNLGICRERWVLLPGIARARYATLIDKQADMLAASEASVYNKQECGGGSLGIIACGIGYNYVKEAVGNAANILKVSHTIAAGRYMSPGKRERCCYSGGGWPARGGAAGESYTWCRISFEGPPHRRLATHGRAHPRQCGGGSWCGTETDACAFGHCGATSSSVVSGLWPQGCIYGA